MYFQRMSRRNAEFFLMIVHLNLRMSSITISLLSDFSSEVYECKLQMEK